MNFNELDVDRMVERVLAGEELARAEADAVLNCPDANLPELLAATLAVRQATFGRRVKICILRNAQSGICPEDCHYCSQSESRARTFQFTKCKASPNWSMAPAMAVASGARRYCMVCSMRGPGPREIEQLAAACEQHPH